MADSTYMPAPAMPSRIRRSSGSTRAGAEDRVVHVVLVGRGQVARSRWPGLLVGVVEDAELQLGAGQRGPAALGQPVDLRLEDLPGRGDHRGAVLPGRSAMTSAVRLVPGHPAQRGEVGHAGRSRRSRAPRRTSRTRPPCSCRRPPRAGSCSPPRGGRATSSRKNSADRRLPCRRPCMSVKASTTVSIVPSPHLDAQLLQREQAAPAAARVGMEHGAGRPFVRLVEFAARSRPVPRPCPGPSAP